jgi:hypothetical protein
MEELDFTSPHSVAAFFIAALCSYSVSREGCLHMIDALKGPQRLNTMEKQFIHYRMMGKASYIGRAYLAGAAPENDYTPDLPYTVVLEPNPATYEEDGYATVLIRTAGADRPRPLKLRQKAGQWFLWEYTSLFGDIQKPVSFDPWR